MKIFATLLLVLCATTTMMVCAGSVVGKIGNAYNTAKKAKEKYDKLKDLYDKAKGYYDDAKYTKDVFDKCRATGASAGTCTLMATACLGIYFCTFYFKKESKSFWKAKQAV